MSSSTCSISIYFLSYSLSDSPAQDHYRISVKRERGIVATKPTEGGNLVVDATTATHPAWLSNLLHDTLQEGDDIDVAYPFGDFFLDSGSGPVVLLAAGVGVTPLMAMLNALLADGATPKRKITWIQAARTPAALPFRQHISDAVRKHPEQLQTSLFYSNPEGAPAGEKFIQGRIDLSKVDPALLHLEDKIAEYYTCGPESFMLDMSKDLRARGVDGARIHAEAFGPGGLPI
jgi:nitric oxide dioxygenase